MAPLPLLTAFLIAQGTPRTPEICFDLGRAKAQDRDSAIVAENDAVRQAIVRKALAHAFERYPAEFLANNVKTVYVVRDLSMDGAQYGGTTGDDGESVVITDGDDTAADPDWVETVFHHETAHVLMENYGKLFSRRDWKNATGKDFRYAHRHDGGYWAIREGVDDDTFRPELNEQGPLNDYGASCFDEDWATYAQNVVKPSPEFTGLARRYARVAKRAALVEAFYEKACPGWIPSSFGANGPEGS